MAAVPRLKKNQLIANIPVTLCDLPSVRPAGGLLTAALRIPGRAEPLPLSLRQSLTQPAELLRFLEKQLAEPTSDTDLTRLEFQLGPARRSERKEETVGVGGREKTNLWKESGAAMHSESPLGVVLPLTPALVTPAPPLITASRENSPLLCCLCEESTPHHRARLQKQPSQPILFTFTSYVCYRLTSRLMF